jgi:hypothetical protein
MTDIRQINTTTIKEASVDIKAMSLLPRAAEAAVNEGMIIPVACRWLAVMMQCLADKKDDNDERV